MVVNPRHRGAAFAGKPRSHSFCDVHKTCGLAREKALTTNANITG
jgi:hypothetical protein